MTARPTRAELYEQYRDLQQQGLTPRQIGERFGKSAQGVRNLLSDPDGSKQRARRSRYQGVCSDCGGPTDGANGRDKAPTRCIHCARGVARIPVGAPDRRRRIPVRLTEIPFEVRVQAAIEANRWEKGEDERKEILFAAVLPSNQTYWVAPGANDLWQPAQQTADAA